MPLTVHARELNSPDGFAEAIEQYGRDKIAALIDARIIPLFPNHTFRKFQAGNPRRTAKNTPVLVDMDFTFSDEELA